MEKDKIKQLLTMVKEQKITVEEAVNKIKLQAVQEVDEYAKIDLQRGIRQGRKEVIYGEGKTPEQITGILKAMQKHELSNILITRLSKEAARQIITEVPLSYDPVSKTAIAWKTENKKIGKIVIATGGTSDIPVAEEAAVTAECFGSHVVRLYDVGVAGIHRLLSNMKYFENANVVIAVAGMEGALASVIGGMVDCPVIAVPTSVGYGANFGGVSALLAMLNSCASGVSVVNIDNGFGAGFLAGRINQMIAGK